MQAFWPVSIFIWIFAHSDTDAGQQVKMGKDIHGPRVSYSGDKWRTLSHGSNYWKEAWLSIRTDMGWNWRRDSCLLTKVTEGPDTWISEFHVGHAFHSCAVDFYFQTSWQNPSATRNFFQRLGFANLVSQSLLSDVSLFTGSESTIEKTSRKCCGLQALEIERSTGEKSRVATLEGVESPCLILCGILEALVLDTLSNSHSWPRELS